MENLMRTCLLLVAVMGVQSVLFPVLPVQVCYTYLGCFPTGIPWNSFVRPVPPPQSPEVIDTKFYLYTRAQTVAFNIIKLPNVSVDGSTFNGTKPTFVIIQGFKANSTQTWVILLKDALLAEFDGNVIIVDWSKGANYVNYLQAVSNTRIAAAELRRVLAYVVSNKGAAVTRMHLIGHSLGAHVAGYVGKELRGIARITALDAAQPAFESFPSFPSTVRLDKTDAVFLEAIHTNGRPFIPSLGLGYMNPIGHVDFYVNGGMDQPGCTAPGTPIIVLSLADLLRVPTEVFLRASVCPHNRAYELFIASVANKNNTMWGHKATMLPSTIMKYPIPACTKATCSPLGLQTINYPGVGVFLVRTTGSSPYFIAESTSDIIMAPFKLMPTATL